jgi:hypothetical protein
VNLFNAAAVHGTYTHPRTRTKNVQSCTVSTSRR